MQRLARAVPIAPHVTAYAVSVLAATHPDQPRRPELVRDYVRYGGSPRGAQALVTAGKIYALLDGRFNVSIDDIRAVALPALRHRVILNFEGEAEGITTEAIVRRSSTPSPPPASSSAALAPTRDDGTMTDRSQPRRATAPGEAGQAGVPPVGHRPDGLRRGLPAAARAPAPDHEAARSWRVKGGRRSVKRGQSVEFADFRDYTLGDRPAPQTRLERPRPLEKLFIKRSTSRKRDVTISFLLDLLRRRWQPAKPPEIADSRSGPQAAALGYIGLASEDRVAVTSLAARAGRRTGCPARFWPVSACCPALSAINAATGRRTCRGRAATRRAAHGRGVSCCISDLLDPAADKVIRELAATGSELIILHVLSPDELDPTLEGDVRLVDVETGDGIDVTVDLATIDDYKARLAAWQEGFADLAAARGATYVRLSTDVPLADLVFAELRAAGAGVGRAMSLPVAARAARAAVRAGRRRDVPAQAAARRARRAVDAAVQRAPDRRRGERPGSALREACSCCSSCCSSLLAILAPAVPGATGGLAGDVVVVIDTRRAWPRPDVRRPAPEAKARSSRRSRAAGERT
jgi:hypothetical protein